jgi:hypothetical protein
MALNLVNQDDSNGALVAEGSEGIIRDWRIANVLE